MYQVCKMTADLWHWVASGCLLLLLVSASNWKPAFVEPSEVIKEMPSLADASGYMNTVHITSEVTFSSDYLKKLDDENEHHRVGNERLFLNEYLCLGTGQQAFTLSSMTRGLTSYYIDAANDKRIYQYRPYSCETESLKTVNFYPHLWQEKATRYELTRELIYMKWFGVSALWDKAAKSESTHDIIYMEDLRGRWFVKCNRWSFDQLDEDFHVAFYFEIPDTPDEPGGHQLRSVMLESKHPNSWDVSITINVLEVEKTFNYKVFDLPIGFGCLRPRGLVDLKHDVKHDMDSLNVIGMSRFLIDMQISASLEKNNDVAGVGMDANNQPGSNDYHSPKRFQTTLLTSSTLDYQWATGGEILRPQLSLQYSEKGSELQQENPMRQQFQMVRITGTDTYTDINTKTVWDQSTGVSYTIDYTSDNCQQESFNSLGIEQPIRLNFKNGLSLELSHELWNELFFVAENFYLVREHHLSQNNWLRRVLYMERELTIADSANHSTPASKNPWKLVVDRKQLDAKQLSIVRRYNSKLKTLASQSWRQNLLNDIDQVSVMYYNEDRSKLLAQVVFLMDFTKLDQDEFTRDLFDVTPCFSEQENHHYAWIRLTYPLTPRLIKMLDGRHQEIKHRFSSFNSNRLLHRLSSLQVPKVEVSFDTESSQMLIRALILDKPSLLVQFRRIPDKKLEQSNNQENDQSTNRGLSEQVVHDEDQCGKLCKLIQCKMFSFCRDSHLCLMVRDPPPNNPSVVIVDSHPIHDEDPLCNLFILDEIRDNLWMKQGISLHYLISMMQHDNYDSQIASKLLLNEMTSNNGTDDSDVNDFDYLTQVDKWLRPDFGQSRMPLASFMLPIQVMGPTIAQVFVTLVPSKFELENDPLNDLVGQDEQLNMNDEGISARSISFYVEHESRKYKYSMAISLSNSPSPNPNPTQSPFPSSSSPTNSFRLIKSKLSYEECSLYCIDQGIECDSFSYCHLTEECIISLRGPHPTKKANSITLSDPLDDGPTVEAPGCIIAKRDYLKRFIATSSYKLLLTSAEGDPLKVISGGSLGSFEVSSASECANDCLLSHPKRGESTKLDHEMKEKCRSFEYCSNSGQQKLAVQTKGTCHLLAGRKALNWSQSKESLQQMDVDDGHNYPGLYQLDTVDHLSPLPSIDQGPSSSIGAASRDDYNCEHYERSYLADFELFGNRAFEQDVPLEDYITGVNLDECSRRCYENTDCQTFQFCFTWGRQPLQSCSLRRGTSNNVKLWTPDEINKRLMPSDNCHVYLMYPNLDAAIYRGANGAEMFFENQEIPTTGPYYSKGAIYAWFVTVFILSSVIGALVVLLKNNQVRRWLDTRFRLFRLNK